MTARLMYAETCTPHSAHTHAGTRIFRQETDETAAFTEEYLQADARGCTCIQNPASRVSQA